MRFFDKVAFGKRVTDQNGFVHAPAVITRVGVQQYHVDELRRDKSLEGALNGKSGLMNVFRPPETVFNPLTIDSFKNMPVTVSHPDNMVHPENARYVQAGHIGEDVKQISNKDLGCTIHLTDKDAIAISHGIETSAGYDCPIIAEDGEFEGVKYSFRFDGPMIGNHLALVPAGRCGPDCKVLDNKQEMNMDEAKVQAMIDAAIGAVDAKIQTAVTDAVSAMKIGDMVADACAKVMKDQRDAEEAAKLAAQNTDAQKQADAAALESKVALRAKVQPLLGDKYDASKTDHELLVLAIGDSVKDADKKSDAYLQDKLDEIIEDRKGGQSSVLKIDSSVKVIKLKAFGK